MKKNVLFSILLSVFLISCSNLHFNDTTSVSMYLPELGGKSGESSARSISAAEIFDGLDYDTDVYFYEINLMQGDTVKYSKKSKGGKTVTFKYIRPGDYSVECFAKVQRNFNQTTFLSGYTELNIVKGQMAEAEVGMVNCPVITQQPTNSIYDPSVYMQGLNESVYVEVKDSDSSNQFLYEWYLDGEKLTITDNPSLDFFSSGKEPDVNTMHTVNGIIYNCPEGWEEGQPLLKKDGFVRIDTVHLYPLSESDFIGGDPFEVGCYFQDKVFSESDMLYPEDFYMNINTKKGTIKIPHLTEKFFSADALGQDGSFILTRNENELTKSLQLVNPFTLDETMANKFRVLYAEVKIGYPFRSEDINTVYGYYPNSKLCYYPLGFYESFDKYTENQYPAYLIEQDISNSVNYNYQWYACDSDGNIICALKGETDEFFTYDESIGFEYFKVKVTVSGLSEYVINAKNGTVEIWSGLFYPAN